MASFDDFDKAKIEYPLDYSIKIMGVNSPDFIDNLLKCVQPIIPDYKNTPIRKALSKNEKYVSVTFYFRAKSREQVMQLYTQARSFPGVVMVL